MFLLNVLQIADAQPLISHRIGLDQVIKEYTAGEDQVFVRKIEVD